MQSHPHPFSLIAGLLALILAPAPAPAQFLPEGVAPAEDAAEAADPVTEAQVRQLRESGLIARQTQIGEGLLLMDRQLRQAQLAQQVMALLGADLPVEVAPGEFRDFSQTPLGIRERIAQMRLELELLELSEEVEQARGESGPTFSPLSALFSFRPTTETGGPRPAAPAAPVVAAPGSEPADEPVPEAVEPEISVRELRGGAGRFTALLRVDRVDFEAVPGTTLPGGIEVITVQPEQVVVRLQDGRLKSYLTPK